MNPTEDEEDIADVPVSPLLSTERRKPYGGVPGLDDEELADPVELEQQVELHDWEPILRLQPEKDRPCRHAWEYDPTGNLYTHDCW
jgi:hypothetical protein